MSDGRLDNHQILQLGSHVRIMPAPSFVLLTCAVPCDDITGGWHVGRPPQLPLLRHRIIRTATATHSFYSVDVTSFKYLHFSTEAAVVSSERVFNEGHLGIHYKFDIMHILLSHIKLIRR